MRGHVTQAWPIRMTGPGAQEPSWPMRASPGTSARATRQEVLFPLGLLNKKNESLEPLQAALPLPGGRERFIQIEGNT